MADLNTEPRTATTVEQTSKKFKLHQLIGFALMVIGIVAVAGGAGSGASAGGFLFFVVGLLWYILARVGAWWHHG